jgi:outer membrane protein assembly factor BamB
VNHWVYAVDVAGHEVRWKMNAVPADPTAQPVVRGIAVYFVDGVGFLNSDGYFYEWDALTSDVNCSVQTGDDLYGPAVDGNLVVAAANADGVYAWNGNDCSQVWHVQPGGSEAQSRSAPVIADGIVYVAEDNTLYALREKDGSTLWSFDFKTSVYEATPAVVAGDVYMGAVDCTVGGSGDLCDYALNATTGAPIWRHALGCTGCSGSAGEQLQVTGDQIYGETQGAVYALSAADGSLVGQYSATDCPLDSTGNVSINEFFVDNTGLYIRVGECIEKLNMSDQSLAWIVELRLPASPPGIYQLIGITGGLVYYIATTRDTQTGAIHTGLYTLGTTDGSAGWFTYLSSSPNQ